MSLQAVAPRGRRGRMENKNERNENNITLKYFNCTMDKMDRDGGNKSQRLYICSSNCPLSKLIVNSEFEDLWRRDNPDTSYLSIFSPNAGKYGPENTPYLDTFKTVPFSKNPKETSNVLIIKAM